MTLRAADAVSTRADAHEAVRDAIDLAGVSLGGATPDLAALFWTGEHTPHAADLGAQVREATGARRLIGASCESVVGSGREIEEGPALALWLLSAPGLDARPFHLSARRAGDGIAFDGRSDAGDEDGAALLMIGDPFSLPMDVLLRQLEESRPDLPVIGGMASAGRAPGENALLIDGEMHRSGAVAFALGGDVEMRSVVSQGCRPIDRPWIVTKVEGPRVLELGGRPALERLREALAQAGASEREQFQRAPQIGVAMDEHHRDTLGRGDFLVRIVLGFDPKSGALAVGEQLRRGQTVQFHVRDADSADEDLRLALDEVAADDAFHARSGLLFTCNGRGKRLFGAPDHDVAAVRTALGEMPLAGFFAAGEIGPVGGRSFLHGFTASLLLFGESA